jgi:type VI secretion system protein ImpH
MSGEKWRAARDLVRELGSGRRQVEFFQLVRLIERIRCLRGLLPPGVTPKRPAGTTARLADEATRFSAAIAGHFQAAPVLPLADAAPPAGDGPTVVETTFMSAAGAQGVLPAHYTTLILQRLREGDPALKDFLDLFHHRIVTALVRGWEKHRPHVTARPDPAHGARQQDPESATDLFTRCVRAITNRKRYSALDAYDDNILLYYSGVFSDRRRPAGALAAVLTDYFRVPVRIREFHPLRTRLRLEHRWRLPAARDESLPAGTLGQGLLLGESVHVVQTSFLVQIGPLSFEQFRAYLPQGGLFPPLNQLIRYFVGVEFVFTVQLLLSAREAPEFRLGSTEGASVRLGWETWLFSGPVQSRVLDDVRFVVAT